jgi:hypothetical protein
MIDFLVTPIGIWVALTAVATLALVVGAALSLLNSLTGEAVAQFAAIALGLLFVVALPSALFLSGMSEVRTIVAGLYAIPVALFLLYWLVVGFY